MNTSDLVRSGDLVSDVNLNNYLLIVLIVY